MTSSDRKRYLTYCTSGNLDMLKILIKKYKIHNDLFGFKYALINRQFHICEYLLSTVSINTIDSDYFIYQLLAKKTTNDEFISIITYIKTQLNNTIFSKDIVSLILNIKIQLFKYNRISKLMALDNAFGYYESQLKDFENSITTGSSSIKKQYIRNSLLSELIK